MAPCLPTPPGKPWPWIPLTMSAMTRRCGFSVFGGLMIFSQQTYRGYQKKHQQEQVKVLWVSMSIYYYEWLYPFAGGRSATPVSRNVVLLCFKTPRNFFCHFRLTWPAQAVRIKCVFWCHTNLAAATVISVQLQSIQHWHYARLFVQCCSSENLNSFVFGRVVSFKSAAPTHGCFDLSYPILGTVVTTGHEKIAFGLLH